MDIEPVESDSTLSWAPGRHHLHLHSIQARVHIAMFVVGGGGGGAEGHRGLL